MKPIDFLGAKNNIFEDENKTSNEIDFPTEKKLFYHSIWFEYLLSKLENLIEQYSAQLPNDGGSNSINLSIILNNDGLEDIKSFAKKLIEEKDYAAWASRLYTVYRKISNNNVEFSYFIEELSEGIKTFIKEEKNGILDLHFDSIRKETSLFFSRVGIFNPPTKNFYEKFLCSRFDKLFLKLLDLLTRVGVFWIANEDGGKYNSIVIYHSPLITGGKLYEIKSKYYVNKFDAHKFFEVVFSWKNLIKFNKDGDLDYEDSFVVFVENYVKSVSISNYVRDAPSKEDVILKVFGVDMLVQTFVNLITDEYKYDSDFEGVHVFYAYLKDKRSDDIIAGKDLKDEIALGQLSMLGKRGTLVLIFTKEGYTYLEKENLMNFIKYYSERNSAPLRNVDDETLIMLLLKHSNIVKDFKKARLFIRIVTKGKTTYENSRDCYKVEFDDEIKEVIEKYLQKYLKEKESE